MPRRSPYGIVLVATADFAARHRLLPVVIMAGAAALNLSLGFRALAGVCALSAAYLVVQALWGQADGTNVRAPAERAVLLAVLVMAASLGIVRLYDYAATSGMLGVAAQEKYDAQSGGAFGVVLGGRSEALGSLGAIVDSPVIGHGSWAKDPVYVTLLEDRLARLGYVVQTRSSDLIPSHSHVFGAWVESGVMGAVFWLAVLTLPVRVLMALHLTRESLSPLFVFVSVLLVWDVLFSPFGAERRLLFGFNVALLTYALDSQARRTPATERGGAW